jgi:mono/diheme cytochrome c family protein
MTAFGECKVKGEKCHMRLGLLAFCMVTFSLFTGTGCRQKMADQPYYRPYEPSEFFEDGRSNRPLERGVIHRGQYLDVDPLATGLTREEWDRAHAFRVTPKVDPGAGAPVENRERAIGAPRFDPPGFDAKKYGGEAHAGPKVYVDEFPFPITKADLKRGQERYTIYCAVCHGPLGNGQGKIWERGYLTPTSFHTEKVDPNEVDMSQKKPGLGMARGYAIWDINIPLRDVPVGYYFEVITKGFGGMPSYSAQIPPEDRWRIIAYIRVLQLSQHADASKLPDDIKKRIDAGGKQ